ncbi:hypothetical protein KWI83_30815 [Streptomyces sp. TRM70350]|nr:hypothetical protein [Streptomyces sp. TRM70350]MBV7699835.1 hypothetical protein [Streptomyces sp. TRM70350]
MVAQAPTGGGTRLLTATGARSVNGTKATPSLSGDLFGDWCEEVIRPRDDNFALRIPQHTDPDHQAAVHAGARPAVPSRDRPAEHRLQPTAEPGLAPRRRHEHTAATRRPRPLNPDRAGPAT